MEFWSPIQIQVYGNTSIFNRLPTFFGLLAAGGLEVEKTAPRRRRNHKLDYRETETHEQAGEGTQISENVKQYEI